MRVDNAAACPSTLRGKGRLVVSVMATFRALRAANAGCAIAERAARSFTGLMVLGAAGGVAWPQSALVDTERIGIDTERTECVMAGSVNKVILIGNLGADPEIPPHPG